MEEDVKSIAKKIRSAVTDSGSTVEYDVANKPGIANLLEIYATVQNISIEAAQNEFSGQQYGAFKSTVADAVVTEIEPIQKRFNELMNHRAELDKILKVGAEKANIQAERTLQKVMKKVGLVPPAA